MSSTTPTFGQDFADFVNTVIDVSLKGSFSTNLKGDIESFYIDLGLEPGTKPIVFIRTADMMQLM